MRRVPGCPGDYTLHLYVKASLDSAERSELTAHIQGCPRCLDLLVALGPGAAASDGKPWPPAHVDEYQLVRRLGRGSMGEVHLARDTRLDRDVAIKFMLAPSDLGTERMLREARAVARVHHPHVVAVYRVGEVDGRPYMVTELVDGTSLAELALPLPAERVRELGLQIASGLAAAHRQQVLHRDLKLHNVMLSNAGVAKLVDFGLAKETAAAAGALDSKAGDLRLTQTGAVVGTPRYLAPELWQGGAATPQTDVWAFGTMLYELLCGAPPFAATTTRELRDQVCGSPPAPIRQRAPATPPSLAAVVERCLARAPEQRFASADELVAALQGRGGRGGWRAAGWVVAAALVPVLALVWVGASRLQERSAGEPALREALALWRSGSTRPAQRALERALALDPELSPALVWRAMLADDAAVARESARKAGLSRGRLSSADAALLDALEPGLDPVADLAAWRRALDAQLVEQPRVAVLHVVRARVDSLLGDADAAVADLTVAERVDPAVAAIARSTRGRIERERYRADDAFAAWSSCLQASPRATDCLASRWRHDGAKGDCAAMEADARAWVAADPDDAEAWRSLAMALYANGAGWSGVETALAAAWEKDGAGRWGDELRVAAAKGDFEKAAELARAEARRVPNSAPLLAHFGPEFQLVLALNERGDRDAAREVAETFLSRARGWVVDDLKELQLTLLFTRVKNAGAPSRADGDTERARLLERIEVARAKSRRTDPYSRSLIWVLGYATSLSEAEDAREAMRVLPQYEPLPPPGLTGTGGDTDIVIGALFSLAGERARARPYLESAARSCLGLENPYARHFALRHLGQLEEADGNVTAARKRYEALLEEWPAGRTADLVRERLRALDGASAP